MSVSGVPDACGYKRLKVGCAHFAARLVTDACGYKRLDTRDGTMPRAVS